MGGNGHAKKERFLAALAVSGNISAAAKAARCHRNSHYGWMRDDPKYPGRYQKALDEAADALEEEARRRAVEGVRRIRFHKGAPIMVDGEDGEPTPYVEHEYSDTLLIFLLKAARPEKFRERYDGTLEVKGAQDAQRARYVEQGLHNIDRLLAKCARPGGNGESRGDGLGGNGDGRSDEPA